MKAKYPKTFNSNILSLIMGVALSLSVEFPASAASACNKSSCDLIAQYVNPAIEVLSFSFGLIATASIIMGAIQYSASEGDPQKTSAAKNRIFNTLIAIAAFLMLWSILQFLIPGGVFHGG